MASDPWDAGTAYSEGDRVTFAGAYYIATKFYDSSYDGIDPTVGVSTDDDGNEVRVWTYDRTYSPSGSYDYSVIHNTIFWAKGIYRSASSPLLPNDVSRWSETYNQGSAYDSHSGNGYIYEEGSNEFYINEKPLGFEPYFDEDAGHWVYSQVYPQFISDGSSERFDATQCCVGREWNTSGVYSGMNLSVYFDYQTDEETDNTYVLPYVNHSHPMFHGGTFYVRLHLEKNTTTLSKISEEEYLSAVSRPAPYFDPDIDFDPFEDVWYTYLQGYAEGSDPDQPNRPVVTYYLKYTHKRSLVSLDFAHKTVEEDMVFWHDPRGEDLAVAKVLLPKAKQEYESFYIGTGGGDSLNNYQEGYVSLSCYEEYHTVYGVEIFRVSPND